MGFTDAAQANLRALRSFCNHIEPWNCTPAPDLLLDRGNDEAYALANSGQAYGVYFVLQGKVGLKLAGEDTTYELQWINIETGETMSVNKRVKGGQTVQLETPSTGSKFGWAATLVRQS